MTEDQRATDARVTAAGESVAARFRELYAEPDFLGPLGRRFAASVLASVSLTGPTKVGDLTALPVLADATGRRELFLASADALLEVPWTGDYDRYEPVRQVLAGADRRCALLGRGREPFATAVLAPEDGRRDGNLKWRASGGAWKRMRETRDQTADGRYGLLVAAAGIQELWLAWALGGSLLFSRRTIDAHLERTTERLRALRAIR